MREKARNETAVKPLKTNNHAKCCFGAHNDFNDLRPALRNVSFRQAKDSFRFCGFWAAQGAKRNARLGLAHSIQPAEAASWTILRHAKLRFAP